MARCQQLQILLDHGELDGRFVIDRQLVESSRHGPAFLQPPDARLDHRLAAVRRAVEPHPAVAGPLVTPPRITALMPCRTSHRRMRGSLYSLSPASRTGRQRGRPRPPPRMRTRAISGSNRVDSWNWPAVTTAASGTPRPSQTRCTFVPNPARPAQGVVVRLAAYRLFFGAPAADRLARMLVSSTQKLSESIRPAALGRACSRFGMPSSNPLFRRALSRW